MEFVIIWLICGGLAAAIASSNGASGCLGFALGVLLGPLGVIGAFFVKGEDQKSRQKAKQTGQSKDYRRCPYCQEVIHKKAKKCRYCKEFLEPEQ